MGAEKDGACVDKKSIRAQAAILMEMVAQSKEYRQYAEAKERLQNDREQAYILSQLRQQQMNLRLAQLLGENMEQEADDFDHLYGAFCLEPVISEFLYAEGRLGRLLTEIQQICSERLDLWSEFEEQNQLVQKELN